MRRLSIPKRTGPPEAPSMTRGVIPGEYRPPWTFEAVVHFAELLARCHERDESAAPDTFAGLAAEVLRKAETVREEKGRDIDTALSAAFAAGRAAAFLELKIAWEREALVGGKSLVQGARGREGGRPSMIEDPGQPSVLLDVLEATGAQKRRRAAEVASLAGVKPESVERAARRLRARLKR